MTPEDLKLCELLRTDEQAGTIHFQDRRMVLIDADVMGLLRKELVESLGADRARRILTRFGFAHGYRDALTLRERFDWTGDEDLLRAGPRMHALQGYVGAERIRFRVERARGIFEDESIWRRSISAELHRRLLGPADGPVCWPLTGYASGFATAVFGSPVFYVETACLARGDEHCRILGRAEGQMDPAMRRQVEYFRGADFDSDLRRLRAQQEVSVAELRRRQAEVWSLRSQVQVLQEAIKERLGAGPMIGASPAHRALLDRVDRVAATDATVLICGETGTGKDLLAREIHTRGARRDRPLITINCAALPATLVESELFGHEKGAFTGADRRKPGRFELAHGGTLFLDEVGELPPEAQAKLLRALQQGEIEPLGGTRTVRVDVRVLAATNRPLERMVAAGTFRADLFYRLNVFPLTIPPLRARPEDILPLAEHFVGKYALRSHKAVAALGAVARQRLLAYDWPGNVRELEHVIERAVLLADGEELTIDLPPGGHDGPRREPGLGPEPAPAGGPLLSLADMERAHIQRALHHTRGVIEGQHGAAAILRINASTLRSRMKKFGLR